MYYVYCVHTYISFCFFNTAIASIDYRIIIVIPKMWMCCTIVLTKNLDVLYCVVITFYGRLFR